MGRFLANRLLGLLVVMFLVVTVVFVIARVVPGDPAAVMLGTSATPQDVAALRVRLGLDQPLIGQYLIYLRDVLRGDLGNSIFLNRPVVQALAERAELTAFLTLFSILIAVLISVPIGIVSAVRRGSLLDQGASTTAMFFSSLPSFWIGLMLIQYLALRTGWFPVSGYGDPGAPLLERLRHLLLPALALGIPNSALIMRFTRTSMLDVIHQDYVRTARAKGLRDRVVVLKHAFRNAFIPVLTVVGLTAAVLVGGAMVTETVFNLPGVGNLIVSAVLRRDYPVIQGALLVISGLYVLINLLVDLTYAAADPRVKY